MDMKQFKRHLAATSPLHEAPRYKIYHDTIHSAFQTAIADARRQGYEISDDEEFDKVTTARKPYAGETQDYHLNLTKAGKPQRKLLHIQIYKMDHSNKYELNFYIQ
jgi:hypothetical protein